jgi:hypothetical protein
MNELESRIRNTLNLDFKTISASGFYTMKCKVCGDRKVRAGIKFEDNLIAYNCFRGVCDATVVYDYSDYPSKKFKNLMEAYGIEIPIELLIYNKKTTTPIDKNLYDTHKYIHLKLPKDFVRYDQTKDTEYKNYLKARGIYDKDYYIGGIGKWRNKLIVPFRYGNIIIGWQGFDIRNKNAIPLKSSGNSDMIYLPTGYVSDTPIIVEGVFDAKSVVGNNGIAILQNTVSKKQAYFLKDKKPILLPDRTRSKFLNISKKYKWKMCIPEWKEKDINDAIKKYGRLVVAKMVHDGITTNVVDAEIKYKIWLLL